MISYILGIVIWCLNILSFALLIYTVMSIFIPQNKFFRMASVYVEPILSPFRELIYRIFPKVRGFRIDFSPVLVWFVIDIAITLLSMLRRAF